MSFATGDEDEDGLRARIARSLGDAYVLGRELGGGGMSRVFLAEDKALARTVVVKVLSPSLTGELSAERFAREIRLSASLQHPCIVPVLAAGAAGGVPYYTMPFVSGESLQQRMARTPKVPYPLTEAVALLRDVARALAFAHDRGIVHRDIKPANILLTGDAAMVADFGVAKALDVSRTEGAGDATTLTHAGSALGTPAYMSPEQAAGDPMLDQRSDLYSFGIVAYELLTGAHPFADRRSIQSLITAHLAEPVRTLQEVRPELPVALADIVMRCVAKLPDDRPPGAHAVVAVLASVPATDGSPGAGATVPTAEGSAARQSGARTTRPRTTRRTWLLAGGLAMAVLLTLFAISTPRERVTASGSGPASQSPGYDAYVRGRVRLGAENRVDNEAAITLLREAVAADPNLAPALAELARAYAVRAFYYAPDSEKTSLFEDARVAVDKALALDPDLAEAYFAKGLMLWTPRDRFPHEQSIVAYQRALTLNPRFDEAHHQLALVLLHVGLLDEAWAHIDSAILINPSNTLARFRFGVISLYRGAYGDADAYFRRTPLNGNPSLWAFQEASVLFRLGRSDEATALIDQFLRENPTDEGGVGTSVAAMIAAKAGRRSAADSAIARAIRLGRGFGHFHHTAFNIAVAQAMLGRRNEAIRWLEEAAEDGFPCYPLFASDPELGVLRSEPRFVALLARLKSEMDRLQGTLRGG